MFMTHLSRPPTGRAARAGAFLVTATLAMAPYAAGAQEGSLAIELNKVESTEEGCRTLFVFDNRTGHELNRFRVDLILFDAKGVYSKQLMLDMAPLYPDKKTVASFLLGDAPCEEIGSILVNDLPQCQNASGSAIDCLAWLKVDSKSDIPLEK
jgi:hypothetical protein